MTYHKTFERWYKRHTHVQCLQHFQRSEYKQALYNAWKAGRQYQKKPITLFLDDFSTVPPQVQQTLQRLIHEQFETD